MNFKTTLGTLTVAAGILIGGAFLGDKEASASGYGDPNSIVDYMISTGQDHSFSNRKVVAEKNEIVKYRGTAKQNTKLLNLLRGNGETSVAPKQEAAPKVETEKAEPQGKTVSVTATAYTAYCEGCSGVTSTGIDLRANPNKKVIAVDPNVIPLGSRVYVEGYGEAIAGDVGGAIKGNRIDVFIPSKSSALDYGIQRNVDVTILN